MPRLYPHVDRNATKICNIRVYGILKSKSILIIFERHENLKYKFRNKKFWTREYFIDTLGCNEKATRKYIQEQLAEDKLYDQMNMKKFIDHLFYM